MRANGIHRCWRPIALLVLAGVALTGLWAAHAHRHPAAPAGSAAAQAAINARGSGELSRLSAQAQSVISSTVGAADRRFAPTRRTAGYRLAGGRVTAALGRGGISVDGDGARLALGLLAVGRPGRMRQLAEVTPTVRAQRVVYARGRGVREWYAAGPLGVEQGFTMARRPPGHSGAVMLALAVGGLRARLRGSGVDFVAHSGRVALRYGGLVARDARGRRLRAWLSLSHSRLLLKAADRGARYPLLIDPFMQQGSKLTAGDETGEGGFGTSVAVSADGDTALIGGEFDNQTVGAAWVFVRSGGTWTQQGPKLTAGGENKVEFGASVALSGDGNTALIGGPDAVAGPRTNRHAGAAWVFTRSGSTWTQQGPILTVSDEQGPIGARFGQSVALSADGSTALIGGEDDQNGVGAAWVFTRSGSTWNQQGPKLTASDESGPGSFGQSVALSGNGNTALIGGLGDNGGVGAAWSFARSGGTWTQQGAKLTAGDESGPGGFGSSVALSGDGGTALIGAPTDNGDTGAAWVFKRLFRWTQQGSKLTASDESGQGSFGQSVSLSTDAGTALIGGPRDGSGAAWAFTLSAGTWTQHGPKLTATGESAPSSLGKSVTLSGDGDTALIGGPTDNGFTGAAWVFSLPPFIFWDNPQVASIGSDTVDGDSANVNQSFITGTGAGQLALEVAVDLQHLYWTTGVTIGRANLDGTGVNEQFIRPSEGANNLAVDDKHIYWAVSNFIGRANLDGSGIDNSFIVLPFNDGVSGLAVDNSHLYWSDGASNTIGRANLDGSDVDQSFIRMPGTFPGIAGIATDGQHLYWSEEVVNKTNFGTIGRANVDGTDVDHSFITGAYEPFGIAVDYGHVYWANQFDCNAPTPSGCDGGTIGRANLDGSDVNQSFITADQSSGPDFCLDGDGIRCGPSTVAVGLPDGPDCLRMATPPAPRFGGAVFARPLDPSGTEANVVVIPAGDTWTGADSCAGITQGADEVMSHPTSVSVAPGSAVLLHDTPAGLVSAWGGQNVGAGDPAPVLFPGRPDWQTTEADVVTAQQVLDSQHGCPGCVLPDNLSLSPGQPDPNVGYQHDLSGATINGATLNGSFAGWNFSGAQLPGASLNKTDVSGADFTGADLRGAQLTSLQESSPPTLANVRVGRFNGSCTVFRDIDLMHTPLTPVKADLLVPGCENSALLPGSTAPLDLIHLLTVVDGATVDYGAARFLVTAVNHAVLAGADLRGVDLAGASFIGFPADLESTDFNGAALQSTSFELADLHGATFQRAQALGASFVGAGLTNASFAGASTDLENADFIQADVSYATFQNADISGAVFDRALAVGTSFNSVLATNTRFDGTHVYGDGAAFDGARQLTGADFVGAVLAGSVGGTGGFDLTGATLTDAKFDNAQCIACNFTGSTLNGATFSGADLPGAQLSGVTLPNATFDNAWLYCGDLNDDSCRTSANPQRQWPLALGSHESYGPVPFPATTLNQGEWTGVTVCPDGTPPPPNATSGCQGHLLPSGPLTIPAPCSAAGLDACPTPTSTLLCPDGTPPNATSGCQGHLLPSGSPTAVVPAAPPTWASGVTTRGYYVGLTDGTIRLGGGGGGVQVIAGSHDASCPGPTQPCGDGGPASGALLGSTRALAVGLDGSLYIADPTLHRVRRIDPAGDITTVAGNGQACSGPTAACGDGGPATAAALSGPAGVWASPSGELFIADGVRGIREVLPEGTITTIGPKPGSYDVVSVAGDADGDLYAATNASTATGSLAPTNNADYLIQVNIAGGQVTSVVGTGTSGYNGNTDPNFGTLLPGTQVQINQPEGLSVALNGDVIFADTGNDLIRAYVPSTGNVIDDLGGLVSGGAPQGGFNGDGLSANQTTFEHPAAVTATRGALLVVADTGNSRVRQFGPNPLPAQLGGTRGGPEPPTGQCPPVTAPPGHHKHRQLHRPPNNHFTVSHIRTHRDGTITLRVTVHGPGTIDVLVTACRDNLARASVRLQPAPGRFVFARRHTVVRRARTLRLTIRPNKRGRRLVHHHTYRVTLRLWVSFTPTGGRPRSIGFHGLHIAK